MKDENEFEIRLNKYGEVDIDYYVAKAHQMRDEAILSGLRAVKNGLMKLLQRSTAKAGQDAEARAASVQSGWPWVDLILRDTPNRSAHHG